MNRLTDAAIRPLDDLAWLDEAIGDARVVAIGESSHYNREFYELRHLLLRRLAERHGFGVLAMETGFAEGWRTDAWIGGGDGEPADRVMAQGMSSLMGLWTEMRAQLEWMRGHARPLRFYGVDLPGSMCSLLPGLDAVLAYLAEADPGLVVDPALREVAGGFSASSAFSAPQALAAYGELAQEHRDALTSGLADLATLVRGRRLDFVRRTGAEPYERAAHILRLCADLDGMVRAMVRDGAGGAQMSIRDAGMAASLEWILEREERVVVAAHNAHLQRCPMVMPGVPVSTPMGMHLADRLGDDYVVIGTTYATGRILNTGPGFYTGELFTDLEAPEPGSLDALMAATHDEPFALDLRRLSPSDAKLVQAATRHRISSYYGEVDPLTAFDVLVHLPRVTPAHPDEAALAHAPAEVREPFAAYLRT
ncbi:erythromycin esterase family protein [Nonomuraea endophytica]|uniref:erythromycin esterase family protein n=1 Tax=Nonomuraea endophytica TaxID=714136 RepID=UPI0037C9EC11